MSSPREISYPTYLELDALLSLQRPQSKPEHPDELIFIVVHQASELWFKVLLHEFDHLIAQLEATDAQAALTTMQRINTLVELVAHELSALDTLPPQRFMQFRGYLGSSSGSQSAQFRAIEATSGLRDPHFMSALKEHGELPPKVARALEKPTLQALFLSMIERQGVSLEAIYTEPQHGMLLMLAESFLAYEQGFAPRVPPVPPVSGPMMRSTSCTCRNRHRANPCSYARNDSASISSMPCFGSV